MKLFFSVVADIVRTDGDAATEVARGSMDGWTVHPTGERSASHSIPEPERRGAAPDEQEDKCSLSCEMTPAPQIEPCRSSRLSEGTGRDR